MQNNLCSFFSNKKILITGDTGFKGAWLSAFLDQLGAELYGISDTKVSSKIYALKGEKFNVDIRNFSELKQVFDKITPDIVFHLAANAITLQSFKEPLETISTNVMGTANILECIRVLNKPCIAVMITSDKCYENQEWVWGYRENDRLGGKDPYSASKSMSELLISSYYQSFFKHQTNIKIASCRAGNVIGGGDFAPMRVIPDCIRAWTEQKHIEIRNPESIRPWSYVLDILYGYLLTAYNLENKTINGESFNFGPDFKDEVTVLQLVDKLWKYWGDHSFIPYKIAENTNGNLEHKFLKLNKDKANKLLGWNSLMTIEESLKETAGWYREFLNNPENIESYSIKLVKNYIDALKQVDKNIY